MGKIKRGGYIFVTWIGDRAPRHVHVFKNNRLVLILNLERSVVISGKISHKLKKLLNQIIREGLL